MYCVRPVLCCFALALVLFTSHTESLGSRVPPDFLSNILSEKWRKCAEENEVCDEDADCCSKLVCKPTLLFRGPKNACTDMPLRSYRHLAAKPLGKEEGKSADASLTLGDMCETTAQCGKGLCCQKMYLFRKGEIRICDNMVYYSSCLA